MRFMMILVALLAIMDVSVQAGPPRRSRQRPAMPTVSESVPSTTYTTRKVDISSADASEAKPVASSTQGSDDALDEVNAERAKRGLRPFQPDALLNQAARTAAAQRAASHIHGHLSNDFACVPSGGHATAAGCGALEPSWGWGTCCTYDNYTYAGAAWVMGSDGRRYMHLFVR